MAGSTAGPPGPTGTDADIGLPYAARLAMIRRDVANLAGQRSASTP